MGSSGGVARRLVRLCGWRASVIPRGIVAARKQRMTQVGENCTHACERYDHGGGENALLPAELAGIFHDVEAALERRIVDARGIFESRQHFGLLGMHERLLISTASCNMHGT